MNKNYVRGRNKEYRLVKQFREAGYTIVQRTAGSHSPVDIIAVHKEKRKITFIQAKPNSMTENKKEEIKKENEFLNGVYDTEFIVL